MENPELQEKLEAFSNGENLNKKASLAQWLLEAGFSDANVNNFYNGLLYGNDQKLIWLTIQHIYNYYPLIAVDDFEVLKTLFPIANEYYKDILIQLMLKINPTRGTYYVIKVIRSEKTPVALGNYIKYIGRYKTFIPQKLYQDVLRKIANIAVTGTGQAQEQALVALGQFRDKKYYHILAQAVNEKDDNVRYWAVVGIWATWNYKMIQQLRFLRSDPYIPIKLLVQDTNEDNDPVWGWDYDTEGVPDLFKA